MKLFWKRNAPIEAPADEAESGIETRPPYSGILRKMQDIFLSPGPMSAWALEKWATGQYRDEFLAEFPPEWIGPLLALYARPDLLVTACSDDDWEWQMGALLGEVMRKFPEQMTAAVGGMLDDSETRGIAIYAFSGYGRPDALPYFDLLVSQTDTLTGDEIMALTDGLGSVINYAPPEPIRAEAAGLLRRLSGLVPVTLTEAYEYTAHYRQPIG